MANNLDPKRLESTIEHLEAWCLENGLLAEYDDGEPVDPAEVLKIVKRYEGMVESDPCPVLVVDEPLLVERRKSLFIS